MKSDLESTRPIIPGSIVQVTAKDDRRHEGMVLVVAEVETWGVVAWAKDEHGPNQMRFTWNCIEPTGGMAVVGADGSPVPGQEAKPRPHHP